MLHSSCVVPAVELVLAAVGRDLMNFGLQELRPINPVHLHEFFPGFRDGFAPGFPLKEVLVEVLHVLELLNQIFDL